MKIKKSRIPNYITSLRIICTALLIFTAPITVPFYILYTLCGLTDVLDGAVARATKSTSEFGAMLDSIADLLFYVVMLIKIFPILLQRLPGVIWYIIGAVIFIRLTAYAFAAVKYRRFAALHTLLNKFTGFLVFSVPYIIGTSFAMPACFGVTAVAGIAALEELVIHIISHDYYADIKTFKK